MAKKSRAPTRKTVRPTAVAPGAKVKRQAPPKRTTRRVAEERTRGATPPQRTASAPPNELSATQRRIIDAALGVFAERGYEGATTAQIATRAGVAEKTLFANFGSKERLYQTILEPATVLSFVLPDAIRTFEPVFEHPPETLRALLQVVAANRVAFALAHARELKLLAQHLLLRPDSIVTLTAAFQDRIAPHLLPVIERLQEKHALRSDVPVPSIIRSIATTFVGYVLMRVVLRPDLPWDDELEIEHVVSLLVGGLAPRSQGRGGP